MKTRIIILLVASAIMVSFGATKITKSQVPVKKTEMQPTVSQTASPIGGIGSEDH